jgi:hypothetical protein
MRIKSRWEPETHLESNSLRHLGGGARSKLHGLGLIKPVPFTLDDTIIIRAIELVGFYVEARRIIGEGGRVTATRIE